MASPPLGQVFTDKFGAGVSQIGVDFRLRHSDIRSPDRRIMCALQLGVDFRLRHSGIRSPDRRIMCASPTWF